VTVRDELLPVERDSWRALAGHGAAAFFGRVLADDVLMLLPGGLVLSGRDACLAAMTSAPPWSSYRLEDEQVLELSDGSAVVAYRAVARREGQPAYEALMSSVYVRRGNGWRLAFHQQTPL
jgi:hypothetical protein